MARRTLTLSTGPAASKWLAPQPPELDAPVPEQPDGPIRALTIDQLEISPYNVRTDARDTEATSALEGSILQRGIILPLIVHPIGGQPMMFGVFAGGRRMRSVRKLVDRGELPAAYPIPVIVRDLPEAELLELSTAENLLRRDLREYEVFVAIRRAFDAGEDVTRIAEALGQEVAWVRKCLRLGQLAPAVFAAFAEDRLTLDQARAYAATEDQALQLATFESLAPLPEWQRDPTRIRAAMGVSDAQAARLLRFVGEEAYRAAGGRYELDLFADAAETRGRVVDDELLRTLANDALAGVRERARAEAARDIRFAAQAPRTEFGVDYALEIHPERAEATGVLKLPEGDVIATIDILESGEAQVRYWWASRRARSAGNQPPLAKPSLFERMGAKGHLGAGEGAALPGKMNPQATIAANAAIKEAEGLSENGIQVFRSIRRAVLRAMLVQSARNALQVSVATDYLIWAQCRMMLGHCTMTETGIGRLFIPPQDPEIARLHLDATRAQEAWQKARAELQREPFMTNPDPAASYALYRALPRATKELAVAIVAGLALERSLNADGYRIAVHDALAKELYPKTDHDVRYWAPPTEALLNLLPAHQRLALVEPWIERVTFGKWQRLKGPDLTRMVHQIVAGASGAYRTAGAKIAAIQWNHDLLRFGVTENVPAPAEAPPIEAGAEAAA